MKDVLEAHPYFTNFSKILIGISIVKSSMFEVLR
jgi:hypothetical protein